jgi:hypothetical protein
VLDERHGDGVEHGRFLRRRHAAGQLQESHIAEIDLAEQVAAQVAPVQDDPVGLDQRDVGFQLLACGHGPDWAREKPDFPIVVPE